MLITKFLKKKPIKTKTHHYNFWVLFLLFVIPKVLHAQQYNFDYINIKNGLINNTVKSIYQDKKGVMYFGTNSGVSIYYGNGFKNFNEVQGKKIGIINQIVGNEKDSIYVIASTIPFFYQLNGQNLKKYTTTAPAYIYSMYYEENKFLVCADNGLFTFENTEFKKVQLVTKDTVKFISKIISCNNDIWLIGRLGGSMELVNKKTLQTTAISNKLTITQFYKDGQNNIWIATKDKGILLVSANDIANNKLQLSPIPKTLEFLSNAEINDITGDKDGNIYFATLGKGLVKMFADHSIEIINTSNGLSSLNVRTTFIDREGNLWIGTNMGIDKLSANKLNIYNDRFGLQSNICYDATLYKNRYLITPNNLGFSVIDDETKKIINFPLSVEGENYPFKVQQIENEIYTLSKNNLSVVNKNFDPKLPYRKTIQFPSRINALCSDFKGNILAGGIDGIWQVKNNLPVQIIKETDVRTIMIDNASILWIGKYDNGIVGYQLFYNNNTITATRLANWQTGYYQDHSRILVKGNNNTFWYGTRFSGLYQLELKDSIRVIRHYNAQNGLSSDFVQSLCLDIDGSILIGTADGLDIINAANNYTTAMGVHKKFNFSSKINQLKISDNGVLWMATDDGILNLEIRKLQNEKNVFANLYFNAIRVKGISNDENLAQNRELLYHQNSITFSFSANSFVNENNILYSWQLIGGSDTGWSEPNYTNSTNYNDLKPGRYTFNVHSVDGATKKIISTASYSFLIKKPFWLKTWFLLLTFFIALFLLYKLIKFREGIIANKEAQKTEIQKIKAADYQYQLEIEQVENYFNTTINENKKIDELLWDVTKNCISKLGFEDCVIYLIDKKRNVLVQKTAWGNKITADYDIMNAIEIPFNKGIVGTVAVTGKPEIISDTSKDSRYIKDDAERLSEIAVPIINNNVIIGVIDSEHPKRDFYTARHLRILTTIAAHLVNKIDKLTNEQLNREKELEVLQLQKDLATSQLTTLRAQMNPHFIFNVLNSIQQYILTGNVDEANKYLAKFSKLQREILQKSSHQFIFLENEIELLQLYLQLEQLRFDKSFVYHIQIDPNIDSSEIKIPTMVLQPFIENAIWHGLMPKPEDKMLSITFHLENEDFLHCIIRDNGIGRAASEKSKSKQRTSEHKSKGQSLVEDRLNIMKNQYKKEFKSTITDLLNAQQQVIGTEVYLVIYIGPGP